MTKEVESPCIGVCGLFDGVCRGCGRTTEEVTEWYNLTDEQKQAVLDRLNNNDQFD